jgi:hypothetical protein
LEQNASKLDQGKPEAEESRPKPLQISRMHDFLSRDQAVIARMMKGNALDIYSCKRGIVAVRKGSKHFLEGPQDGWCASACTISSAK